MNKSTNRLIIILAGSFLARLLFILLDNSLLLLPYQWDTNYYQKCALQIKSNIINKMPLFLHTGYSSNVIYYSLFASLAFFLPGNGELNIRIINALIGVAALIQIYRITLYLYNEKAAVIAVVLTSFWPSYFLFTTLNMRDPLIILLSLDIVYRVIRESNKVNLLLLLLDITLMGLLRKQNLLLFLAVFAIYVFYLLWHSLNIRKRVLLAFLLLIIVISGFIIMEDSMFFQYFSEELMYRKQGGSVYLEGMNYNSLFDIVKYLPLRFIHFTYGPFPWHIDNLFMLMACLESMFLLCLSIFVIYKFLGDGFTHRDQEIFILIFIIIGLAGNAAIDSNYGTAVRHRLNYIIFVFVFVSYYLALYIDKFRKQRVKQ